MAAKEFARQLCPPLLWDGLRYLKRQLGVDASNVDGTVEGEVGQDLEIYWDPHMSEVLETWGIGNVWYEIQLLLATARGRVLDIACGTGGAMVGLSAQTRFELHGCDISDLLISKAIARNIVPSDRLVVGDATKLGYDDKSFNHSYSIGSLEHFTDDGIAQFLSECNRVTRHSSFHQIPVSRSDKDEGWLKLQQSFHNNSVAWWLEKYRAEFRSVRVMDSLWQSPISLGRWFVCSNDD